MEHALAAVFADAYVGPLAIGIWAAAMIEEIVDIQHMIEELKQQRTEVAEQIHMAAPNLKDDWELLERKWDDMRCKGGELLYLANESSDDIWAAVLLLRDELKLGYERIKKAL